MTEFTEPPLEEISTTHNMDGKSISTVSLQEPSCWKVYVDSAANRRGSRVGLVLISPEKLTIEKSLRLGFSATNNKAEYKALRNVHGSKNGRKGGKDVLRLEVDCQLSEGRARSKR